MKRNLYPNLVCGEKVTLIAFSGKDSPSVDWSEMYCGSMLLTLRKMRKVLKTVYPSARRKDIAYLILPETGRSYFFNGYFKRI